MANRIAVHDFNGTPNCIHCGESEQNKETSCIFRDAPPRPVPKSIFADLGEIGARLKEIQAEENAALAGTATG